MNQDLYWVGDEHRELQRQIYKPLMDTQIILQNIKVIDYYKNLEDIEKARLQKLAEEAAAREEAARIEREAREEAERIEREAELARQEKLRLEKEVRLNAFLETSTISAEYAAEIFSSFIESYPKVIRIVGDVTNYWNDINQALSEINSGLFFELDLLNTEGLIVFPMISCKNIEGIFLPNGCERISTKAFYDCPNIKKISIPKSVKNIDESAFENCKSLETVDYSGSKKDWKAIKIEKNNKPIQKAKINYE